MRSPIEDRFWSKVVQADDCWVWTASTTAATGTNGGGGYGTFRLDGRTVKAHRYAYATLVGDVPEGLELDHLCRNRACVNPYHLEPVTKAVNLQRGVYSLRERSHCKRGHEFTAENTYWYKASTGSGMGRRCKTCQAEASARYEERRNHATAVCA